MSKIHHFNADLEGITIPKKLNNPFDNKPHPLCILAANQLQEHLTKQTEWMHNFGLSDDTSRPIGKMFGVLVVQNTNNELGFLAAFSGKLAGQNHHSYFVPPVYDSLCDSGFLNKGMANLKVLNDEVKQLKKEEILSATKQSHLLMLREKRQIHSQNLLHQLFDAYVFYNTEGKQKSTNQLFVKPPAGAGECAAPKLLQYAYKNQLKPISITEFWWGSPPSTNNAERLHASYYPACKDKCRTILAWMLS